MYKKVCDFVDNTHTICTNFERIEFNLNNPLVELKS